MLRTFKRLISELAKSNLGEPDESLWSPSGWSEAATGPNAGSQFTAPPALIEAPITPTVEVGAQSDRKAA